MSTSGNNATRVALTVLYGLGAGFAATVVIVLGPIILGLFAPWICNLLGWKYATELAMEGGLGSI